MADNNKANKKGKEAVPAAEIGKREFVRALSVDEADTATAEEVTKPFPDLRYPVLNPEVD